jgi:hypothetical protein
MHGLLLSLLLDDFSPCSGDVHSKTAHLFSVIQRSSLCYFGTTSVFTLYHATKFRRPKLQFDVVYGCMQIFNVHIGKPERLFTNSESFEELNDELVIWLVNRHGSSSQMFIHTQPALPGKSWRFSLRSEVTDDFMPSMFRTYENYIQFREAKVRAWGLRFFAMAYRFDTLAVRWSGPTQTNPNVSEVERELFLHRPAVGPLKSIAMDENAHLNGLPPNLKGVRLRGSERTALVD